MKVITIKQTDQLESLFQERKAVVFKHSTRCPVSARAKEQFERFTEQYTGDASFYLIDVIENRDISQLFSKRSGIKHQSPQIIVIESGSPVWSESHLRISHENLKNNI